MSTFEKLVLKHAAQEIEKLQALVASLPASPDKASAIGSSNYILNELRKIAEQA
jgi:hypothetical protein